jgi:hypothetical protein
MGNVQSTQQPDNFKLHFDILKGSFKIILNPSNFLHACFVGCLMIHSNHQPDDYDKSRENLESSAKRAFSFYGNLNDLMTLLAGRKSLKILRTNPLFMKVMSVCLENPIFPRPTCFMFRSSDPYSWSPEILEIFFQNLTMVLKTELKELNILDDDIRTEQREHPVIDLVSFHQQFEKYLHEHCKCPSPVNGVNTFLEHRDVFHHFLAMLQNSIDVIGFQGHANKSFTAPVWFVENLDQSWKDMLTNGVSRIANPAGFSREFIDNWVKEGRPRIEQ